jgi:hypothetical protein
LTSFKSIRGSLRVFVTDRKPFSSLFRCLFMACSIS